MQTTFKLMIWMNCLRDDLQAICFPKKSVGIVALKIQNVLSELSRSFSNYSQLTFTCSKLTIETLEKSVKYIQN